ncbi:MAG: thioredoxin-dependent thiol peroxidase [Clostridium sp.]|nr:thioredoxin-dependent thiol peroxidase [Clostridium sp.]
MEIGELIPEVLGTDQDGRTLRRDDFAGKKLILYFYPKDMTPGCTAEACSLRDNYEALLARGYAVVGVSTDDAGRHRRFVEKNSLPFPLIADTDHHLAEAFGVWGEKSMCGRKYMGIFRTTFEIGPDGRVERIWTPKQISTKTHGQQLLDG